jgi:predicted acylesterase/phospholipase RssA
MTLKHLVISGGGPIMIQFISAIQHLEKNEVVNMKNIESIYATSAGAIVGVFICLKYDWETINDYIIKRPWHDVFPIKIQNIFEAYTKKGIFDIKTIEKCFKPLLDAKDIPMDVNLEDFYKLSNIDLHIFSFEINEYKVQDISHITHPKLSLMTAIQMTCGLPILVTPVCIDDKCFIDGGLSCNYPLNYCIESGKNPDEILGFKNKYSHEKEYINNDSTLLDFLLSFLFKAVFSISTDHIQKEIKNEIICDSRHLSFDVLKNVLSNLETRQNLFINGTETAIKFIDNLKNGIQELNDSIL